VSHPNPRLGDSTFGIEIPLGASHPCHTKMGSFAFAVGLVLPLCRPVNITVGLYTPKLVSTLTHKNPKMSTPVAALVVSIVAVGLLLGTTYLHPAWHVVAWCSVLLIALTPRALDDDAFWTGQGRKLTPLTLIGRLLPRPPQLLTKQPSGNLSWSVSSAERGADAQGPSFLLMVFSAFVQLTLGGCLAEASAMGEQHGLAGGLSQACFYIGTCVFACAVYLIRRNMPSMVRLPFLHIWYS
jgi:hypothetical protein